MGKLKAATRNKLPKSDFALPSKRAYPINDPSHARNALARVSQFGTPAQKSRVRSAVHRKYPSIGKSLHSRGHHESQAKHHEPDHAEFEAIGK